MLKQIIREAVTKVLLNEVSYNDAVESLDSKRTKNIIKKWIWNYNQNHSNEPDIEPNTERYNIIYQTWFDDLRSSILNRVPEDLEDNQQGLVVLWLRSIFGKLETYNEYLVAISNGNLYFHRGLLNTRLETFFHHNRFMSQKELMKINSAQELKNVVDDAQKAITAYQEQKQYEDAEAGTEWLDDGSKSGWKMAILHNKGAACHYGKGTKWCTAAPGLDFFKKYSSPGNPIIFFENIKTGDRYQFNYGKDEFMDVYNQTIVDKPEFNILHDLVLKHGLDKRYLAIEVFVLTDIGVEELTEEKLDRMLELKNNKKLDSTIRNNLTLAINLFIADSKLPSFAIEKLWNELTLIQFIEIATVTENQETLQKIYEHGDNLVTKYSSKPFSQAFAQTAGIVKAVFANINATEEFRLKILEKSKKYPVEFYKSSPVTFLGLKRIIRPGISDEMMIKLAEIWTLDPRYRVSQGNIIGSAITNLFKFQEDGKLEIPEKALKMIKERDHQTILGFEASEFLHQRQLKETFKGVVSRFL